MRFHLATGLLIALSSAAKNDKDCVKWGDQFQVPLRSKNVKLDCKLPDGRRVCCAAVIGDSTMTAKDSSKLSRGVGYEMVMPLTTDQESDRSRGKSKCEVKARCAARCPIGARLTRAEALWRQAMTGARLANASVGGLFQPLSACNARPL